MTQNLAVQLAAGLKALGFAGAEETAIGATHVKTAYEQLMAEGYLTGVEKKGYFVSAVQPPLTAAPPPPITMFSPDRSSPSSRIATEGRPRSDCIPRMAGRVSARNPP